MLKSSFLCYLDDFHENIAAFNKRHGSPNARKDGMSRTMLLRAQLITEELAELLDACRRVEIQGSEDAVKDMMDAYGDLLYVVIGTGVALDLPSSNILSRVCASNDSKHVTEDSRVRDKGPHWFPPDFTDLAKDWINGL